jgi:putative RecB family exonuclease
MALDLPRTLTPSKVVSFTNCPLAFRFSQIERRPEPPSPPAVKGTLVHAALDGLFWHYAPGSRTPAAAHAELERCWDELQRDDEYLELALDRDTAEAFLADARTLVDNYFRLEDPNEARAVGIELGVETVVEGMRLRGIIDRLDVAADGSLIVVDYKTGRAPSERYERGSMGGVQTYALLCESLLGRAPAEVRLLYLRQPVAISSVASEQTIRGQRRRAMAVWTAIERACDAEDFRPHVGPLCDHCHFKTSCPAFAA